MSGKFCKCLLVVQLRSTDRVGLTDELVDVPPLAMLCNPSNSPIGRVMARVTLEEEPLPPSSKSDLLRQSTGAELPRDICKICASSEFMLTLGLTLGLGLRLCRKRHLLPLVNHSYLRRVPELKHRRGISTMKWIKVNQGITLLLGLA